MSYKIVFSQEALQKLQDLDNQTATRIIRKLEAASENPQRFFERLAGRQEYKLRIGDYRAIANIIVSENTVLIRTLGHRKNIYEQR